MNVEFSLFGLRYSVAIDKMIWGLGASVDLQFKPFSFHIRVSPVVPYDIEFHVSRDF